MTGLASRPGTDVLPTWWIPPVIDLPSTLSRAGRSCSNRAGHSGSYESTRIGSSFTPDPGSAFTLTFRCRLMAEEAGPPMGGCLPFFGPGPVRSSRTPPRIFLVCSASSAARGGGRPRS